MNIGCGISASKPALKDARPAAERMQVLAAVRARVAVPLFAHLLHEGGRDDARGERIDGYPKYGGPRPDDGSGRFW